MSEMVERVARALYEQDCRNLGVEPDWGRGGFKTSIGAWMACARAAIEAMTVPTEEMMAAAEIYSDEGDGLSRFTARDAWWAMIDAALKENADG